jgi:RNA polymerase sigma-70 factor (ECF subfamily)
MHARYDALIDRWSRRSLDNPSDVSEFKQILWLEIARRIVGFSYDPKKSFRRWLKTLHSSRVADYRKSAARAARRAERYRDFAGGSGRLEHGMKFSGIDRTGTETTSNLAVTSSEPGQDRLERARAAVQARFRNRSWEIFWAISMEDRSIRETANDFGMSYAAAFAAYSRVRNAMKTELERIESS